MSDSFVKHIGKIIAYKRKKAGISRKSLAKDIDVSQATLSRYENGRIDIGARTMEKIGRYLGFPMRHYTDTYDDSSDQNEQN